MQVVWARKALKQLSKLKIEDRRFVVNSSAKLSEFSACSGIKRLKNHQYDYRLRVGQYRVLFNVFRDDVEIVSIEEVKKRNESTY